MNTRRPSQPSDPSDPLDRQSSQESASASDGQSELDATVDAEDPESSHLLTRFANGDDSALGRLVDRESPRLMRRLEQQIPHNLRRRIGASDIVQMTAIDLLRVRDRFENHGVPAFRKMLSTMANFILARALERERAKKRDVQRERRISVQDSTAAEDLIDRIASERSTPSQVVSKRETRDQVRACFETLPPADREAILLIDYEGRSHADAAVHAGISETAFRKRHSRAVARLRERMNGTQSNGS